MDLMERKYDGAVTYKKKEVHVKFKQKNERNEKPKRIGPISNVTELQLNLMK